MISAPRLPAGAAFWIAHACFWLAAFAASLIIAKAFAPALADPAWFLGPRIAAGGALTAVVRGLAKRPVMLERLGISNAGLMLGGPLAGAVLITIAVGTLDGLFGGGSSSATGDAAAPWRAGFMARFLINFALLATWSAAYFGLHLLRDQRATELRAFEAEALAARNEVNHLHAQISPHFLFNALNTILACKQSPDDIEAITQALAKYLRFVLRPVAILEPLGREIDALEDYLTIQSFRFGDRLVCRIDCDTDIRRIPVLPVMIQPLVENALKYGSSAADSPLEVIVRAFRQGDTLLIEVANTGRWLPDASSTSTQTGLHTLARRLRLHGGPEATVTTTEEHGWVRVTIRVPLDREYASAPAETEAVG